MRFSARAAGIAVLSLFVVSAAMAETARPLSDAERSGVELAAAYLAGGPAALISRLASSSPLRRMPAAEAMKEIEVRLGPPAGATWELQTVVPALKDRVAAFAISFPSGVDETAILELVKEGSAYRIGDIRIAALPAAKATIFTPLAIESGEKKRSISPETAALALGLLGALLGAAAAFARRESRSWSRGLIAVAGLLTVGSIAIAASMTEKARVGRMSTAKSTAAATDSYTRLAPLLEVRRSLASGSEITTIIRGAEYGPVCRDVSQLWKAQLSVQQMRISEAKQILSRFDNPSNIPLVEVLRGRIAVSEQDESRAALAYEHAVSLGPGRDALWGETAHALLSLGYEDRATRYFDRLSRIGSRDAEVYYILSMYAAFKKKEDESEKFLRQAWQLRPARRSDVIAAGALWSTIRRPGISEMIPLSAPDEATVVSPVAYTRPVALPAAASASISGDYLDVRVGDAELAVPGGAALAPAGTPVVDAGTWQEMEARRGLADFERLAAVSGTPGAYTQPALRQRIMRSALALADRNRWADLVRLTDGLSAKSEHIPPMLFFLRATGLKRLDRSADAKQLLVELAGSRVLQRRRDARSLEDLGEMLAALDMHDAAIKMFDRAQSIKQSERVENRVAQVQMNKRLATKYLTYNSGHFEIHYPEEVGAQNAAFIGKILEDELKRLQAWVPAPHFQTVVVNVVWWQDFRSVIAGNDYTLGLYQGKITVPLAGIPYYPPFVVSILSHELCHAMIAQATHDQAPHWFHEGLASRIEMVGMSRNAFNMYDDSKLLALNLLDTVISESPDPEMIGEGYLISQAAIRYIESRYGKAGLSKLMEQFRNGANTEEAIAALSGKPVAAFDKDFRQWGRAEQRVFESPILVRYDNEDEVQMTKGGVTVTSKTADAPPATTAAPAQKAAPLGRGSLSGGTLYPMGKKP